MAVSIARFLEHLRSTGCMSPSELTALETKLPAEARQKDAADLARDLVRDGKLTKFQAAALYQDKAAGLVLGNYLLLDKLGEGGMGQVFRARHRRMDRVVALKMLPKRALDASEKVERFQREVKAAAKLTHPNIVVAYDADEADGTHFLVMECVEGSDLSSLVKKQGPLPVAATLDFIRQAARGLQHAHSQGITHRDIKPSNLLLDKQGNVKILDMGLARVDDASPLGSSGAVGQSDLTTAGSIMGTVDYMAPEQAMDSRKADARSDIYSLGCTLHYLLTGKSPYGGDTLMKRLTAHQQASIPLLSQTVPQAPAEIDAIFQKMLAKRVAARYQTMADVLAALDRITTSGNAQPASAPRPVTARAIPNVAAPKSDSDIRQAHSVLLPGKAVIKADSKNEASHQTAKKASPVKLVAACVGVLVAVAIAGFLVVEKGDDATQVAANDSLPVEVESEASPSISTPTATETVTITAAAMPLTPDVAPTPEKNSPPPSKVETQPSVDALPPAGEVMPAANSATPAADSPIENAPTLTTEPMPSPAEAAPSAVASTSEPSVTPIVEPAGPERLSIPDADTLSKADALLKEIFKDDLAEAKTDEARSSLAQRFIEQASGENDDAAGNYALLQRARDLAIDAGDPALVENTIQLAAAKFDIDPVTESMGALEKMIAKTRTPAGYKTIAEFVSIRGADLSAAEKWDDAKRLYDIASNAARKSKDAELVKQLTDRSKVLAADKKQWDTVEAAKATLEKSPDDAAAHLVLGRYYAFVKGDWAVGFNHLAKSNDSVLKELGAKSVAVSNEPDALVIVGDAWWDSADKPALSKDKENLRTAAGYWYGLAVDNLTGLAKTRVEKRLTDINEAKSESLAGKTAGGRSSLGGNAASGSVVYLDDLAEHDWIGLRYLGKHGLDQANNRFVWKGTTPPHSLFTHPMSKSTAHVRYSIGGSFDTFSATVGLSSTPGTSALTFQVIGDGNLLWRSQPIKVRDMGIDLVVPVRGVKELVLEVVCPAAYANCHAVWVEPKLQSRKPSPQTVSTKTGTSGPKGSTASKVGAAVGLNVPQELNCAVQPYMFQLGPAFDFARSWTFAADLLTPSFDAPMQTIFYYSRDNRGGGPLMLRLHGAKLEARIQNTPAYTQKSMPVFEKGFSAAFDEKLANQWVSIVFRYDAPAQTISLYFNGELKKKDAAAIVPTPESGMNAKVGISPVSANNGDRYFGKVRNLRLFNEDVLSLVKEPVTTVAAGQPVALPGVPTEKIALAIESLDCAEKVREFVIQSAFDESQSWTARLEFQRGAREESDAQTLFQEYAGKTGHRPLGIALEQGALKGWIGNDNSVSQMVSAKLETAKPDAWTAVILRYDSAANEVSIYVDGKLVAKESAKLTPKSNAEVKKLAVGGRTNTSSRFYGKIRALSLINEASLSMP